MKPHVLTCLFGAVSAFPAYAAEEPKAATPSPTASAKPNEAAGTIAVPEPAPAPTVAPKKKAKWSNPNLDLTHCLSRETNTAIIKCAE